MEMSSLEQTIINKLPIAPPLMSLFQMLLHSLLGQRFRPITKNTFKDEYDFIIVGGGAAGSVLASRLSEKKCISVLLLEAGPPPPLVSEVPGLSPYLGFTDIDWQFMSTPQKYCGSSIINRTVLLTSGRSLGGGTLINGMVNNRGNRKNYDDWAKFGAKGWSYEEVLPYFKKLEDNQVQEFVQNGNHGTNGPMTITRPSNNKIKPALMKAVENQGFEFVDPDRLEGQYGFYNPTATIRKGQRCSTAKAYLVPAENRTNLDIVINAMVTKIEIKRKKAVGVHVHFNNTMHYIKAKAEVILSSGAYNTPKLLMLSGIGPKYDLDQLGIPVQSDLLVGHNLQDHINGFLVYELKNIEQIEKQLFSKENIESYKNNRTGTLNSLFGMILFSFLSENNVAAKNDLVSHENSFGRLPVTFLPGRGLKKEAYDAVYKKYENSSVLICFTQAVQPLSRGYVRLSSTDPFDPPEIDPHYFENPFDVTQVINGHKTCMKLMEDPAMEEFEPKWIKPNYPECIKYSDDLYKFLECNARAYPISSYHNAGTAKMGAAEDITTVVDHELKVKRIDGLRVVDTSVMPMVAGGNIMVPTIMIAEKASDIIKKYIKCPA